MRDEQLKKLNETVAKQKEASQGHLDYWELYSHMGTWQFWVILIFY